MTATLVTGRVWPMRVYLLERIARPREVGRIGRSRVTYGYASAAACRRANSGPHRPIVRPK